MKFSELKIPEVLCTSLSQQGIESPTQIQARAIPVVLTGKDLIGSARTGTGKTLAFALPLTAIMAENEHTHVLVLVPTRELGVQIQTVFKPLLHAMHLPTSCLVIGGVGMGPQIQALQKKPRLIIATPGRLNDHLRTRKVNLQKFTHLVLDEADRMLDMGFLPQVRAILDHMPNRTQSLLFTATLPSDLKKLTAEIMDNPENVFADPPSSTGTTIVQKMLEVVGDAKPDALLDIVKDNTQSVLIFARTKRRTDRVAAHLTSYGLSAERIHGDRSQHQRQKAIDRFRSGDAKILVATDIAARGLDIPLVELVVNFDLPETRDEYIHRIGRTGRAGAEGVALSFITADELSHWNYLAGKSKAAPGTTSPNRPARNNRPGGRSGGGARGAGRSFAERSERGGKDAPSAPRSSGRIERPFRENRFARADIRPSDRSEERSAPRSFERSEERSPPRSFDQRPEQRSSEGRGERRPPSRFGNGGGGGSGSRFAPRTGDRPRSNFRDGGNERGSFSNHRRGASAGSSSGESFSLGREQREESSEWSNGSKPRPSAGTKPWQKRESPRFGGGGGGRGRTERNSRSDSRSGRPSGGFSNR